MQGVQVFNCINAERDKKLQVVKTLNDLSYLHLAVFSKLHLEKLSIYDKNIFLLSFCTFFLKTGPSNILMLLGPMQLQPHFQNSRVRDFIEKYPKQGTIRPNKS